MQNSVDLVLNCYEKTYQKLLQKGYIESIIAQNKFQFNSIIVVVSNVDKRVKVESILQDLQLSQTITHYYFVEDYLEESLHNVGLRFEELGKIHYYSTWAYVMVEVVKSEYFLHWDTDISLSQPHDWITPSLVLMQQNKEVMVVNPNWQPTLDEARVESFFEDETFMYSVGISDQLFLGRSSDFKAPIYKEFHLYSLRYPMSHINRVFEMRVDSFMRHHNKRRAIYKMVSYHHPLEKTAIYPKGNLWEYVVLKKAYRNFIKLYKKFKGIS